MGYSVRQEEPQCDSMVLLWSLKYTLLLVQLSAVELGAYTLAPTGL